MSDYVPMVDRRTALAWLSAVGAAGLADPASAQGVVVRAAGPATAATPVARGYGTDPDLLHPVIPWPRTLAKPQLQAISQVCDHILPAEGSAPAASALGVPDFIDEWVSAPYPDQVRDRPIILDGLAALDAETQRRHGSTFAAATPAQREALLIDAAHGKAGPTAQAFFGRMRALTVGAYYTTAEGFKDIGYIGNVPRTEDPGPSPEVMAHLNREFAKLKL